MTKEQLESEAKFRVARAVLMDLYEKPAYLARVCESRCDSAGVFLPCVGWFVSKSSLISRPDRGNMSRDGR